MVNNIGWEKIKGRRSSRKINYRKVVPKLMGNCCTTASGNEKGNIQLNGPEDLTEEDLQGDAQNGKKENGLRNYQLENFPKEDGKTDLK